MGVEYKIQHIFPMVLEGDIKVEHGNKWQKCFERNLQLDKPYRQALSMIQNQCMQELLYKTKRDPYWDIASKYSDPITLLQTIWGEKEYQTEDSD